LLISLGPVNSARPTTTRVRSISATIVNISTTDSWPAIAAYWADAYSVQTADKTLTEEELVAIVDGMLLTTPAGP
jgi:hypothetical protein